MNIIVNGKRIELQTEPYQPFCVAYESVLAWVGKPPHAILTVTWATSDCQGSLTPGQRIIVREWMVFNVMNTSNA